MRDVNVALVAFAAVSVAVNVILWCCLKISNRRYRQLIADSFNQNLRAVLTEDDIVNRVAAKSKPR